MVNDADELDARIKAMDDGDREHFRKLILVLSRCYSNDGPRAVVSIEHEEGLSETITINCDDMEAFEVALNALEYLEFVNTKDAPPKEKFN